jgi:hypothetical protein
VDARLHQLQGKAELVNDLLTLLQDFYEEKLAAMQRHIAHAQSVGQYDFNNTYQYILNREDVQLSWLAKAIGELGGTAAETAPKARGAAESGQVAEHAVIEEDARDAQTFFDRWRPRVDAMANARHAKMLRVILGEVLEQKRFFEQALAGRTDLLGKRAQQIGPAVGAVLPTRWIE